MLSGIAVKRSRFGEDAKRRKLQTTQIVEDCIKAELNFVFFDFEWSKFNLTIEETRDHLNYIDYTFSETDVKDFNLVITFAARSNDFYLKNPEGKKNVDNFLDLMNSYEHLTVDLVAGNDAYFSDEEKKRRGREVLFPLADYVTEKLISRKEFIFTGSEGLLKTSSELAKKYNFVPFLLMSERVQNEISLIKKLSGVDKFALYSPFAYGLDKNWLLDKLGAYILRRAKTQDMLREQNIDVQELQKTLPSTGVSVIDNEVIKNIFTTRLDELCVYGTEEEFYDNILKIKDFGVEILAGLPLKEEPEQFTALKNAIAKI